jgi:hypothetical protein
LYLQRELEQAEVMKAITDDNSLELEKAEGEQALIEKQLTACEQALDEVLDRKFGKMNKSQENLRNAIFGMPPAAPTTKEELSKMDHHKAEVN